MQTTRGVPDQFNSGDRRWPASSKSPAATHKQVTLTIWGRRFPVYLHTLAAVAVVVGGWILLHILGGQFLGQSGDGQIDHLLNMAIFGSVALVLAIATLYILFFTGVQKIVLPHADEHRDITQRWRDGETITEAEARLAMSWAVSSGCRVIAVLLLIGLLATPL